MCRYSVFINNWIKWCKKINELPERIWLEKLINSRYLPKKTKKGYTILHEISPTYNFLRLCNPFCIGLYLQCKKALWNRIFMGLLAHNEIKQTTNKHLQQYICLYTLLCTRLLFILYSFVLYFQKRSDLMFNFEQFQKN